MHLWPSLPISTCWRWKETSARVRKEEGTQGAVAIVRRKKRPRLCISRLRSNEFYSTESGRIETERFGGTHHEILGMHLVRIKIRERKGQSVRIIQKRRTSWAKSLRAQFWGTNTWGNLTSAHKRGRTSFVHDFGLFVTVRLLGETPAVLLLHFLCSKHGYSFE